MKQRFFLGALALCLYIAVMPEAPVMADIYSSDIVSCAEASPYADTGVPTPQEVYQTLIALKDTDGYREGTPWDDSNHSYQWNGGPVAGNVTTGTGCAAFAFELSDKAFGSLPARTLITGQFSIADVRVGDILRLENNSHSVIVLQVAEGGVVVAEGNYHVNGGAGMVHWERAMSKADVEASSFLITRYPEGYIPPDDPAANEEIGSGPVGNLTWKLTKAGVLTISGSGAMPDFGELADRPWNGNVEKILEIRIESGVTSVGSNAFYGCKVLNVSIPDSVTAIGSSAFRESSLVSASIPGSVRSIGDDAFHSCTNFVSVSIAGGVETVGERAFQSCTKLASVALPASVRSVGAAAFYQCAELTSATFAPRSDGQTVSMGDNLFSSCWRLANVTLPKSIDRISEGMFQNCMYLTGLTIPEGAAGIGGSAFASSGLRTIYIPDSVTQIGIAAFASCTYLGQINYGGSESQWNSVGKIGDTATTLASIPVNFNADPPAAENPGTPEEPTNPGTPGDSGTPENPGTSEDPGTPENPGTPGDPGASGNSGASGNPGSGNQVTPGNPTPPVESQVTFGDPGTSGNAASSNQAAAAGQTNRRTGSNPGTSAGQTNRKTGSASVPAGQPYIVGETGLSGWNAIKEKAAGAAEGSRISIDMNGMSVLPASIPESIRGKDITFVADMGDGILWRINGLDVTEEHVIDVSLSVQTDAAAIPQEVIEAAFGSRQNTQLSLASSGAFGYSAVLALNVQPEYAGSYANLFYYHPDTEEFEFICADQVAEDGIAELTFTHASEYVVVLDEEVMEHYPDGISAGDGEEDGGESLPAGFPSPKIVGIETVSAWLSQADLKQGVSPVWVILIAAVVLAAAGAAVFAVRKKAGDV